MRGPLRERGFSAFSPQRRGDPAEGADRQGPSRPPRIVVRPVVVPATVRASPPVTPGRVVDRPEVIEETLERAPAPPVHSFDSLAHADGEARRIAAGCVEALASA